MGTPQGRSYPNKTIRLEFGFIALLLSSILLVGANANAEELKIGFVFAPKVIEESPQAEVARKQLEKEFAPRDKEITQMKKELQKLEDRLNRDGAVMSDAERVKLENTIRSESRDLKRASEEYREDLTIRKNEASERLRRRVFEVIEKIAVKKKFDLIVSEGVVYASPKVDITNLVLDELRAEPDTSNDTTTNTTTNNDKK